ncbi:MAG: hypothetical protein GWM98_08025 [Nitrospinaceae bacterium]|nr:hypothetical protein [Nitrospinaceae bacterium]NIR54451.1 hypothetical protein [Nitrospinaceae bacterium]NIS84870.1 hypothetical protein [Nitrospinaceae bacterium]NIT81682.1 hypothetical protein [Nitrospinaceae bacterium]NIU43953.1 hypothetical protein [Nitrospinaceae bacterium]
MKELSGWKVWTALGLMVCLTGSAAAAEAPLPCKPVEQKAVKIEGYISKKFRKQKRAILKEFKEIGHIRTAIRPFPMGDTAKVIAIGRCVPAYIARHVMAKTLKYTSGIGVLVHQAFLPSHWIGIGTTTFDEPSQQVVTEEQVKQLMDPSLSDEQFHTLYRKFSVQDDLVPYFGLQKENAKKVKE